MDLTKDNIKFATIADVDDWMGLVSLTIDGYPCMDKDDYTANLHQYIADRNALFAMLGGESMAKVFAEDNRNVFEITKNGFIIFSFGFLFSGCNIFSSALFTALSNGKASAAISFLRTFGFITVFLLVLPRYLQVTGVWLAVPLAELFTLMLTVVILVSHSRFILYD